MMIYIALIFGLFTLVGGIMGYVKAGSKPSLISGGISGILILAFTYGYWQHQPWGLWGLMAVSALLELMFTMKFTKSRKIMPSGIMILLSSITFIGLLLQEFLLVAPPAAQ